MHPKIVESFWSDLDFDRFQAQELASVRLTFLWTITSPTTNAAGIFPCQRRVFTSDTGLDFDWLDKTMKAFPRSFVYDAESRYALLRGYVRYQIGTGDALVKNWLMCSKVLKDLRLSPVILALQVIALYPELGRAIDKTSKPLLSPCEALAKGLPSPSTIPNAASPSEALPKPFPDQQNQGSTSHHVPVPRGTNPTASVSPSQGLTKPTAEALADAKALAAADAEDERNRGECITPSLKEVIEWGKFDAVEECVCQAFWEYHSGRNWMSGNTRITNPRRWLKGYEVEHGDRIRARYKKPASGRLDAADDIRAQLSTCTDPRRRLELEQQLTRATA